MLQAAVRVLSRRDRKGRAETFPDTEAHEPHAAESAVIISSAADLTQTKSVSLSEVHRRVKPGGDVVDSPSCVDDLARNVHCVLGVPIDVTDMTTTLRKIESAVARATPFLLSTPNLNFLVNSQFDTEFRESLLDSNLCVADGMSVIWIARLIGVPIREKVSGSDLFDALKAHERGGRRLKGFLFGGGEGLAAAAGRALNAARTSLRCVGTMNPGFGTIEDMSRDDIIGAVNACDADFLVVSLGAKKGQLWLHRNHSRLTIPVRAHLGAVINFQAGTFKRAPQKLRGWGLEWLWRIKEEPHLWRRYVHDGLVLVRLLFTRLLPLAILNQWYRLKSERNPKELLFITEQYYDSETIRLAGDANQRNIGKAIACFQETLTQKNTHVIIDLAGVRVVDGRFLGLLLMVRKYLKGRGTKLGLVGVSPAIGRLLWLNELDVLLNSTIEKA